MTDYSMTHDDTAAPSQPVAATSGQTAAAAQPKRNQKASFEANAQVQRWLRAQAVEDGGSRGPFAPTFLAGQRDRDWVLSSLSHFYEDGLISDVLRMVKSGKEATVYCCAAPPNTTGAEYLAAKVYRPRMFRGLKNDAVYRDGRLPRDADGRRVRDQRHQRGAMKKTESWRTTKVTSWIREEFDTQRLLHAAGADVPRPLAQIGNAMLMEYIGDGEGAAPLLREVQLEREEAQPLWQAVLRNIELCLRHERIHGDLSAYNLLYWSGSLTLIDLAQAVDPRYGSEGFALLARDIERVYQYFARYGVAANPQALARDMWVCYLNGTL